MKKVLKAVSSFVVLLFIITFISSSYAATAQMSLSSTSKLKEGDTVEVTLRITNINAGEGIDAIVATLDYDKNVFEEVAQSNIVGINQWNTNLYSADTGIFTITRGSKINTASDVLKVTLKAKSTINVNSTEIKLKEITASGGAVEDGGTGDIEIADVKVTIAKEVVQPITNTITNTTTNTNKTINTNQTDNKATGRIPQTGESVALVVGIIALAVVATLVYIKYRDTKIK